MIELRDIIIVRGRVRVIGVCVIGPWEMLAKQNHFDLVAGFRIQQIVMDFIKRGHGISHLPGRKAATLDQRV